MRERLYVGNFDTTMVTGGAEKVGEQFCKAMNLKYISSRKLGIGITNKTGWEISGLMDERISEIDYSILVHNSTNCHTLKRRENDSKRIAIMNENFFEEGMILGSYGTSKMYIDFPLQLYSIKNADKIVNVSSGEKDDITRLERDLKDKVVVIEPFIDNKTFKPLDVDKFEKPTGLFVGRQHIRKGWDIINELKRDLDDIDIIEVVGGNITNEELNVLYNKAHFLIMPSRYESFGFIFAEALATNLPIISGKVGMFKTWQPDKYGIFVPEVTTKEFKKAINDFKEYSFEKSRELAENRFSYERFKGDCDNLLNNW